MDDSIWAVEARLQEGTWAFLEGGAERPARARCKSLEDGNEECGWQYRVREYWPADTVREVLEQAKARIQAHNRGSTHYAGCAQDHPDCAALAAIDKVLG